MNETTIAGSNPSPVITGSGPHGLVSAPVAPATSAATSKVEGVETTSPNDPHAIVIDGVGVKESPLVLLLWLGGLLTVAAGLVLHSTTLILAGQGLYVLASVRTFRTPADRLSMVLVSLVFVCGALGFGVASALFLVIYIAQQGLSRMLKPEAAWAVWLH